MARTVLSGLQLPLSKTGRHQSSRSSGCIPIRSHPIPVLPSARHRQERVPPSRPRQTRRSRHAHQGIAQPACAPPCQSAALSSRPRGRIRLASHCAPDPGTRPRRSPDRQHTGRARRGSPCPAIRIPIANRVRAEFVTRKSKLAISPAILLAFPCPPIYS